MLRLKPLDLSIEGRDCVLNALCHSCRFNYLQRVLKTFPDTGYLWLWVLGIYIYIYRYIYRYIDIYNGIQWSWVQIPLRPTYSYF